MGIKRIGSVNDRLHFLLLERDDKTIEDRSACFTKC